MKIARLLPPVLVVLAVAALAAWAARTSVTTAPPAAPAVDVGDLNAAVARVDAQQERIWSEQGLEPAAPADDLTVLRRLSLALHGTLPSLEEIRRFEADDAPNKLPRWTATMLEDTRFADYFAERLGRAYVGVEQGQFIIFRRDRFTFWLGQQLREHRPYDEIVRDMIAGRGVWTGEGEVNFITAGFANDAFDTNKLTGRTVRAFLGQRIDCAQCHDHPFDDWKQRDFEGLAAHFGQVQLSLVGVQDHTGDLFNLPESVVKDIEAGDVSDELRRTFREHKHKLRQYVTIDTLEEGRLWLVRDSHHPPDAEAEPIDPSDASPPTDLDWDPRYVIRRTEAGLQVVSPDGEYIVEDRDTLEHRVVEPNVPFHPEWLGTEGTRRDRLAVWVTHPENKRFERAIANRVWGLMFGRPYAADRAVDDLPDPDDPSTERELNVLDILGEDFRAHGCDLRRLIQVIAASRAFWMESIPTVEEPLDVERHEAAWAVFPLVRLRPEQIIGSMLQTNSVKTIDQNSHLFVRFQRFLRENAFVNEFGDLGDDELSDHSGTIPQALLRMNGDFSREMTEEGAFSAPGRIASYSSTPERLLENAYLVCLTRRPTPEEQRHFLPQLEGKGEQSDGVVQDLFWTLLNSPEFSWNH